MRKTKRKVVAYCPMCEEEGVDVRLVPFVSSETNEDFLCARCWHRFELSHAQAIMESQGGTYRDDDKNPKFTTTVYIMTDGTKLTNGRSVAAYKRKHDVKVRYVWRPM